MKYIVKFLSVLTFVFISSQSSFGQANAGPDKSVCKGKALEIGTDGSSELCYSWSPADGLDDPHSPTPNASPDKTTTYTLTVTGSDFSSITKDEVEVTVLDIQDITFDRNELIADGEMKIHPSVLADPADTEIKWTIEGENLGAGLENDVIIAGFKTGTITIRASSVQNRSDEQCFIEKPLDILDPVKELIAEDMSVGNEGRIAKAGQTLYVVGSDPDIAHDQEVKITAIPTENKFTGLQPRWMGSEGIAGLQPKWSEGFPEPGTETFTARIFGNNLRKSFKTGADYNKEVAIIFVDRTITELKAPNIVGIDPKKVTAQLQKYLSKLPGLEVEFEGLNISYKKTVVPKYKDPETDYKYELFAGTALNLKKKFQYLPLCFEYKLGNDIIKTEVYLELALSFQLKSGFVKDASKKESGIQMIDRMFMVEFNTKAGIDVLCKSEYFILKAGANVSAKAAGGIQEAGKDIQYKYQLGPVQFNSLIELQYDPNDKTSKISYTNSLVLIEGIDSGWTTFYTMPF